MNVPPMTKEQPPVAAANRQPLVGTPNLMPTSPLVRTMLTPQALTLDSVSCGISTLVHLLKVGVPTAEDPAPLPSTVNGMATLSQVILWPLLVNVMTTLPVEVSV